MNHRIIPFLGIAFVVGEPNILWNARLIYSIMCNLGANDPEGDCQDSVYEAMNENESNHLYVIDEQTMNIVSWKLPDTKIDFITHTTNDIITDTCGIGITNIISGINNWIIPMRTWLKPELEKQNWNPATSEWNTRGNIWSARENAIVRFIDDFIDGVLAYADDHNTNHPETPLDINLTSHTPTYVATQPNENPIRYIDIEINKSRVNPAGTTVNIESNMSYPEQRVELNPMLAEITVQLNLERWHGLRSDDMSREVYDPMGNTLGVIPMIHDYHDWCQDNVYALNILWPCYQTEAEEFWDYCAMKEYCNGYLDNWVEGLNNEFDLIYYPVKKEKKEKKVKQFKNSIAMAETKKTNSFMEKMMSRFKGQFLPEKCDEFAMAWDGQIVAKCVAGTGTIYNAIVDGEIVSYPDEAVLDIPMYTILKPANKIVEGDIIVISGTSTGSRFGKVTAIKKKGSNVSSFQVIRFNGTEDGTVVAKDAIMKMGLVEVVFNPFTNNDVFQGAGMNPMMFLLMDGKGGNMQDLMMMSMMMGNKQANMNPMMIMCLMDGKKDMKDLMMMSMMMGNKDNPFANLFAQPKVETE